MRSHKMRSRLRGLMCRTFSHGDLRERICICNICIARASEWARKHGMLCVCVQYIMRFIYKRGAVRVILLKCRSRLHCINAHKRTTSAQNCANSASSPRPSDKHNVVHDTKIHTRGAYVIDMFIVIGACIYECT